MKQITMPYDEYEKLLKKTENQKLTIDKLKTKSNVIVIDERPMTIARFHSACVHIPHIIADESLAKEALVEEYQWLLGIIKEYAEDAHQARVANEKLLEIERSKKWWQKIF